MCCLNSRADVLGVVKLGRSFGTHSLIVSRTGWQRVQVVVIS